MSLVAGCSATGDGEHPSSASTTAMTPRSPALDLALTASPSTPLPLGEPVALSLRVVNPTGRSESVTIRVSMQGPDGTDVDAVETSVFAPHDDAVEVSVEVTPSQWSAVLGDYRFTAVAHAGEAVLAPAMATVAVVEPEIVVPVFEDVTAAAGIDASVPDAECGQFSNGAAFADIDGDDDLDLLVTRLGRPVQLYANDAGHFTEEGALRGVEVSGVNGAGFADYDNDGDRDVVLVSDAGDLLLANDGTGTFTDVSAAAGIGVGDTARGMDAAWGDYDDDGYLDLYVTNYMTCTGEWTTEQQIIANVAYDRDVLYHNEGDGTFEVVTHLLEGDPDDFDDGSTLGAGFGATWFDFDGDGLLDLYLANDFVGPAPDSNRLWHNDGPRSDGGWGFSDVSVASGTAFYMNAMGTGIGDPDRDGDLDLALSNVGASKFVRNNGDGTFTDDPATGIARPTPAAGYLSITWATEFADLNLDGWDDLFQTAGNFMQPPDVPVGEQPNVVYVGDGRGRWLDVSAATGADDTGDSKGAAVIDYDRDGLVDLLVVNQSGEARLYRNVTPVDDRHWIGLSLAGTRSNRDGCGAVVRVELPSGTITEPVRCGSGGGGSGSQPVVHVGLGGETRIERLTVEWPSGTLQVVDEVAIDRYLLIEETPT
jgi:hypothetical protein